MAVARTTVHVLALAAASILAACAEFGPRGELAPATWPLRAAAPPPDPGVATAVWPIVEALTATEIGRSLDARDLVHVARAQQEALESRRGGEAVPWRSPETGRSGEIVPGPVFLVNDSECREYTHVIASPGRRETLRGTACRRADRVWRPLG